VRRRKALRIVVRLGICALAAVAVSGGYLAWRIHKALGTEEDEDLPRVAELMGPPVADSDNAALVYQRAFAAMDVPDYEDRMLWGEHDAERPGRLVYDVAKLEALVNRNWRSLRLLEEAASMPKCQFPLDSDEPLDGQWQVHGPMRDAVRLQTANARVAASKGEVERALEALITCLDMGAHMSSGMPGVDSYGEQLDTIEDVIDAAEGIIDPLDLPGETSQPFRDRLRRVELVAPHIRALKVERVARLPEIYERYSSMAPADGPALELRRKMKRKWYLWYMDRCIELAELPYRELRPDLKPIPWGGWYSEPHSTAETMLPAGVHASFATRDERRAWIQMCILALDLKAYKHEQGHYPDRLGDLPNASQPGYAEDIFSGERLLYRRRGAAYLLYSIGPDLDDDSASETGWIVLGGWPVCVDGDLVWRCSK
jgi:hypothetical protein